MLIHGLNQPDISEYIIVPKNTFEKYCETDVKEVTTTILCFIHSEIIMEGPFHGVST